MRVLFLLPLLALVINAGLTGPAHAQTASGEPPAAESVNGAIPAMPLGEALNLFAERTGLQLVYVSEVVAGLETQGAPADLSHDATLENLLRDTGLDYRFLNVRTVTIATPEDLQNQSTAAGQNQIGQRQPGIEEIIVTGQKREERIQDVPIAISAFSPEDLEAQKIEGGFDLLKGVPNVTFTKTNFTGYNFQIRGIGTQAVSATTDPGVAVSFNNTTLIVNRLFEQEYLDVERVEVLRGPQGTLFGRNATAGVINVISNKPELGVWDGMVDVEVGNYNTRRLRGFFNAPLGDTFAIRGAYASTKRDGFGVNQAAADPGINVRRDVDNRDLWTGRLSLGWQPSDRIRVNLIWEHFEEDDRRVRTTKQLCHRDPGLDEVAGFELSEFGDLRSDYNGRLWSDLAQDQLSQGCLPGSMFENGAYDTPNGNAIPFVQSMSAGFVGNLGYNPYTHPGSNPLSGQAPCEALEANDTGRANATQIRLSNPCIDDPFANAKQSQDLRAIYSTIEPSYEAEADIYELSLDIEVTDSLLFTSQTVYVEDSTLSMQDLNRFETVGNFFQDSATTCGNQPFDHLPCAAGTFPTIGSPAVSGHLAGVTPGGVFCDPQLGCSDSFLAQDMARAWSEQYNQEFRLVSSFDGPWNFSVGANYTRFETKADYFVFSNVLTAQGQTAPWRGPSGIFLLIGPVFCGSGDNSVVVDCIYTDPRPLDQIADDRNPEGHNYFLSQNPYELDSGAIFGEVYWQATDELKVTAGLRVTRDEKTFTPIPSQALLMDVKDHPFFNFANAQECIELNNPFALCGLLGNAPGGRGYPAEPDIEQEWTEPTGRIGVDWSPQTGFTDETLVYAFYTRGYKAGGANPPGIAPPSGDLVEKAQGAISPKTFEAEFVNAYEIGTKNTLFGGAMTLNGTAFFYDYKDYQVSKIVDRSASNENFDAETWGLELEALFAPSLAWQFNAAIGYLNTEIGAGEQSIDLMDRTQGGDTSFTTESGVTYDEWVVVKPTLTQSSNCVAPADLVASALENEVTFTSSTGTSGTIPDLLSKFCPAGSLAGLTYVNAPIPGTGGVTFDPRTDAPNGGAGFFDDLGGNELPNAPHFTVALGGQYNFDLTRDWRATARVDYYWQGESYARVYNTEYDRLQSWSNTNLSFWVNNPVNGITVEAYVKNVFDETPITGTFLNSDDTALTTNVFTLEPRLIGVSVRKEW